MGHMKLAISATALLMALLPQHPAHAQTPRASHSAVRAEAPTAVRAWGAGTDYRRPGTARSYARSQVSAAQFRCLDRLWTRESGWNHRARNPSSGAYGIPQALPAWKMASAGADWRTNPRTQIRWGLRYIRARYGSPCGAWAHSQRHGWY